MNRPYPINALSSSIRYPNSTVFGTKFALSLTLVCQSVVFSSVSSKVLDHPRPATRSPVPIVVTDISGSRE